MSRIWGYRPEWHWHGWSTLSPIHLGGDELGRRTVVLGWTVTGRVVIAISRVGALYPPEDFGCCALDDTAGSGHQGPCGWKCSTCGGSGMCPACDGWAGELAGCRECDGSGACPEGCDEGWRYEP